MSTPSETLPGPWNHGWHGPPHVDGMPGDFAVQGGAVFGFWDHSLVSLHANPEAARLRRARLFSAAGEIVAARMEARGDWPGLPQEEETSDCLDAAHRAQLGVRS